MSTKKKNRARDFGLPFDGVPGKWNSITDVPEVKVGYTTLISGSGKLRVGKGPVRTGVTAILPRGTKFDPVFAATDTLNGNGEMTGAAWIEESGFLESPILITNTHSAGIVRDAVVEWMIAHRFYKSIAKNTYWLLPVVTETYDGYLNDINGFHIKKEHVFSALNRAASGPVAEGNIGGGTGLICHGFKGGTGTSSRRLGKADGGYTVGIFVQANHGLRKNLILAGVPVGKELREHPSTAHNSSKSMGSIIVVIATDAPLLPHQLKRLVKRVPMGVAKTGGMGENTSGDFFIAFSTANSNSFNRAGIKTIQMLSNDQMTPIFEAVIQATEEAVLNAIFAAKTMGGINGNTVEKIPVNTVLQILNKHHRIA